jgi:hypothetical protein
MAVTNHSEIPLAIKIVKKEEMAELERELIARTNKKGFVGYPTLFMFPRNQMVPFEGVTYDQLLITDLIGSSLSWFSK